MLTIAEVQVRVEAVIVALEKLHDRQYPLRSIPMDMVAEAVVNEAHAQGFQDVGTLTPSQIAGILTLILGRNMMSPQSATRFAADPASFDVVSPWQTSSFTPHTGVDRLRD